MKQLQHGRSQVLYSQRFALRRRVPRVFPIQSADGYTVTPDTAYLEIVFTLADGINHHYWYEPINSNTIINAEVFAVINSPLAPHWPLVGGRYFNYSIRPNLFSRDVAP